MSARPALAFRPLAAAFATLALFTSAGAARADSVSFTGARSSGADPVSFSGTLDVTAPGAGTSAVLKFTLTNTTSTGDAVNYGFITGFGFNVPTVNITGTTAATTDTDFKFLKNGTPGVATTLQGGAFDYAFSTSATQLHTVTDAQIPLGIGAGQSATFTVNLTGTGLAGLTAAQIMQELSAPSSVPFSVRFRSTNDWKYQGTAPPDGDKVPVTLSSITTNKPVPAPPGVVLAGIGFGSLLLGRLRRKTAAPKA